MRHVYSLAIALAMVTLTLGCETPVTPPVDASVEAVVSAEPAAPVVSSEVCEDDGGTVTTDVCVPSESEPAASK